MFVDLSLQAWGKPTIAWLQPSNFLWPLSTTDLEGQQWGITSKFPRLFPHHVATDTNRLQLHCSLLEIYKGRHMWPWCSCLVSPFSTTAVFSGSTNRKATYRRSSLWLAGNISMIGWDHLKYWPGSYLWLTSIIPIWVESWDHLCDCLGSSQWLGGIVYYCVAPWEGRVCGPCEWRRHFGKGRG